MTEGQEMIFITRYLYRKGGLKETLLGHKFYTKKVEKES